MRYEGKKVEKKLNCSSSEAFVRCLSALNQLKYNIVSQNLEFGSIQFENTGFSMMGKFVYNCKLVSISENVTNCIIWSEEETDAVFPLFDILFGVSRRYSRKVLKLM